MTQQSRKIRDLEDFLQTHGGHLHPEISIAENETAGLHWRAKKDIEPGSTIISTPHTLAFSYLNALVDEEWPVFKNCREQFRPDFAVEAITFFYLMVQYHNRANSFWRPYLNALPGPEDEHTQPLFFEDDQDRAWLEHTDVWHTNLTRTERYRQMYEDGKAVLQKAGCDQSYLTWDLFKWAVATFTSRSFSSRALRPHDSKYWAAYRHTKDRRSQVVLMDMSHSPADHLDFHVLFPGLDIGNHSNDAKIDYMFEAGHFDIKTNTSTPAGEEVFNNYGPKSNDELLLGYGFCIQQNPHNTVPLMLKIPSSALQEQIMTVSPGYFHRPEGAPKAELNLEKTAFQLAAPKATAAAEEIFEYLPEPLLELLIYILHNERGFDFTFIEQPREYLSSPDGRRYLPHIANIIHQSLFAKLQRLESSGIPMSPANNRQDQAAVYRHDLRELLLSLINAFGTYLESLVAVSPQSAMDGPCLVSLEIFLQLQESSLSRRFMDGIEANANTRDVEQLVLAGWEQDVWVLLLGVLVFVEQIRPRWLPRYVNLNGPPSEAVAHDPSHPTHDLMQLVQVAAEQYPESVWRSDKWSAENLYEVGKMLQFDSFAVPVAVDGVDQVNRLHVYLHDHPAHG